MSENFIRPNTRDLERIATDASQGETIGESYEAMKAALRGVMGVTPPPSHNDVLYGHQTVQPVPADPSTGSHIRVIYPSGNARFEIYSDSEAGLDQQEERIRALYQ